MNKVFFDGFVGEKGDIIRTEDGDPGAREAMSIEAEILGDGTAEPVER